jgi:phage terminase large subunit-like protein
LYEAQERFLRLALTPGADGRLPFPELVFGAPKKAGKTAVAGMAMLYVVLVLGGRYAEGYCIANDLDQAAGRVFEACKRMVEASPVLREVARTTATRVEFVTTGGEHHGAGVGLRVGGGREPDVHGV